MSNIHQTAILALDLGEKRVGLALSHGVVAAPLGFADFSKKDEFYEKLNSIIKVQNISEVIVGLPLGRNGDETKQSAWVRRQAAEIVSNIGRPIRFVEESFTSKEATEVFGRAKQKGETDAQSAVLILERFLTESEHGNQTL